MCNSACIYFVVSALTEHPTVWTVTKVENSMPFRANDIDNFVIEYADQYLNVKDTLEEAMNKLDASFEDLDIPVTSLPQILYACYKIVKNKKSFGALVDKITEFLNTYDDNEEYKLFVQQGTTSAENVDGRFQYWRAIVNELN